MINLAKLKESFIQFLPRIEALEGIIWLEMETSCLKSIPLLLAMNHLKKSRVKVISAVVVCELVVVNPAVVVG